MADQVTTAADLAQMTPAQRHQHYTDSIDTDLTQVRPAFLAQVQARLTRRIEQDTAKSA